ncbi:malate dehydrogenase [Candidatus Bathyarchaeota archaeon]|jgi:malate dehydrogenase (oxaloacetate-decarboxylating)|nr:malate dehydrogenase [Candidatus Bathyarchaeota archaeon]MDP6048213.1 NADP-dependent malic enzyme [Candidatus Bathyarchaeota archaeon]
MEVTKEDLITKASKWSKIAPPYHAFYRGKVEVMPKCAIRSLQDFSIWYTPGVAQSCRDIEKDLGQAFEQTSKWNYVGVVSDGTRVLGLGDIGAHAGMPVMEGKALIFKYLGGVDAFPICLATKDPQEIIQAVKWLEPTFGGINLEDFSKPKCFDILDTLRNEMPIPVWHDDQQGTAAVVLAGVINALKVVGKKMSNAKFTIVGSGAANTRSFYILESAGVNPKNVIIVDSRGTLHHNRGDLKGTYKWPMTLKTNPDGIEGDKTEAMKGSDIVIAASRPGPGVIKPNEVALMADDAIVFACANPIPEIWPWEAKESGAKVVATGRSDFPNQVNNSLVFPAIFRGALDVRAKTISDEMCIASAIELAKYAEDKGINEEYILPTMSEWEIYPRQAVETGLTAIKQGLAKRKLSRQELYEHADYIIGRTHKIVELLMKQGFIEAPPPEPV